MSEKNQKPLEFNSVRNKIYIFLQVSFGLFLIAQYIYKTPVSPNDITEFDAVVKTKPKVYSSGKGHKSIEFYISGCKYKMQIDNAALLALGDRQQFIKNISVGDKLRVSVSNLDYENVIVHKRDTGPLSGNNIELFTLKSADTDYITLSNYNFHKKNDEFIGLLIGFGLLILIGITIIKKTPMSVFLEKHWWIMVLVLVVVLSIGYILKH